MIEQELLGKLELYARRHGRSIEDILKEMHIAPSSYYRWKKGQPISAQKRYAIEVYTTDDNTSNLPCKLAFCPAQKPDRFLQALLETWENLSILQRAEISARAVEYANSLKKGETK